VRPPGGYYELFAASNQSELRKLARVQQNEAHARYLLLLDLSDAGPITFPKLKPGYNVLNAGRGNFSRRSVRIIYIHADMDYHFLWRHWTQDPDA
jgi:hypothetical protein